VIGEILPAAVVFAEAFADPPGVFLFPAEEALLARATDKRRREFGTGRHCARAALRALGLPAAPILPDDQGAPRWPPGIVGSITHCDGYRAVAVARAPATVAIGIDAEPCQSLAAEVLDLVSLPSERARLRELAAAGPDVCWDRLLFSTKEAVYKAWFPLARRWLGFTDADITIHPGGTFAARLLVPGPAVGGAPLAGFDGRWLARDGLLLTAIALAAPSPG